jgi:hypothetical protein
MSEWKRAEDEVKTILERDLRTELGSQVVLPLRGSDKGYRFDLVSKDKTIVIEIKTSRYKGVRPYSIVSRLSDACLLLLGTDTEKKFLVLTDHDLWKMFMDTRQRKIASAMGVQVSHVPV